MKKVIAFAGSNSVYSINKQLATLASNQLNDVAVTVLDLNDYELPMYGIDLEKEKGIPEVAQDFLNQIKSSDGIILSLAEHNGAYAAVFKNIFDWMSRIDGKLWSEKPMLLMAASPGGRGGKTVLDIASDKFPRMGASIVSTFSLPNFYDNYTNDGIIDEDLKKQLAKAVTAFEEAVK